MRKLLILLLTLLCVTGVARGQDEVVTGYDCECLIDGVSVKHGTMPPDGGLAQWQIDAAAIPPGLHQVQTRIVQHLSSGITTTAVYDALCYRVTDGAGGSHQVTATCYVDDELLKTAAVPINGTAQAWTLDLSQLPTGLHHVKVRISDHDNDGVISTTDYDAICYRQSSSGDNSHDVTATCYVDGSLKKTSAINANGNAVSWVLILSDVPEGLHQVKVEITDKNKHGVVTTAVYDAICYRQSSSGDNSHDVTATCYVDGSLKKKSAVNPDGNAVSWVLDLADINEGLHQVKLEVADKNKQGIVATAVYEAVCYRMGHHSQGHDVTATCYIDDSVVKTEKLATDGSMQTWMLDLCDLPEGLHRVRVNIADKDNDGVVTTAIYEAICYRMSNASDATHDITATCFVDEQLFKTSTIEANGRKQTWTLDLASLPKGLHHVRVNIADKDGSEIAATTIYDAMCYRTIKEGISGYEYWINDDDSSYGHLVFDEPLEEYALISLIPVPRQIIRSKKFHFEVNDNQPTLYARNNLLVRFNTADGSFTDVNGEFVDYRVKRLVEDPVLIEPGETKTAPRPQENEILWYKVEALHGDSLSFKADRPCTIQVFSPTGEELRLASADKSVQWCGVHAPQDGTYYIAQHDITATQGNTLSITYQHIDQYAILDYDVHTVGNGGASIITFNGNGYLELDNLYLRRGDDKLQTISVNYYSNSKVDVFVDFTDVVLGDYDIIAVFEEDSIIIPNGIKVVNPDSIRLNLNVSYPSSFLVGNKITYTIEITNDGNSTAHQVPLELQIYSNSKDAIIEAQFSNNIPKVTADWVEDFEPTEVERRQLDQFLAEKGDLLHFITLYDSIGQRFIKEALFAINVPPKSRMTITLTLLTNEEIELRAQMPTIWDFYTPSSEEGRLRKVKNRDFQESACCVREKVECLMTVIVDVADFASILGPQAALIDCIASLGSTMLTYAYDVWCGEQKGGKTPRQAAEDLTVKAVNSLIGCISNKLGAFKYAFWGYQHIYDVITTLMDCGKAFTQRIPNCPPDPPRGGTSTPRRSCEPNDMLGYTAPSGSHYIGNGLTDVYYTIQFENDSSATSPANVIILTDTIDARYFDLNTFVPTQVKIGDVTAQLSGEPNFVQTVDMRPRINCIAQVECNYNAQKGIAVFTLTSLDPMTLERVTDYNQGMLPPNGPDNMGQGEMSFNISLKPGLPEGTVIKNHADNIFDTEDPVFTPDWVNIIDGVKPTSRVIDCELLNDSVAAVGIRGEDDSSGPWRYDIYTQYGGGDWVKAASEVPIDRVAHVRVYEGIEHHFYAVLTDSAGNVETKQPIRELTFDYFSSDTESNLTLNLARGWNWMSHNLNAPLSIDCLKPNAHRILSYDGETINDPRYGYTGNVSQMSPTELYKVEMSTADNIQLSGLLFNSALKPVPLVQGWNWMGYPMPGAMSVNEALVLFEADENDCIVGQDGSAVYNDGLWRGTLTTLEPGKGYLLKVNSDKSLRFNTSRSSVRLHAPVVTGQNEELPWTLDIHHYPNVTPVIADLWDGNTLTSNVGYALAAFVGDECRGIATEVNGRWMMNVYGYGGETITFKAMNRGTSLVHDVTETETFTADLLGTMALPVQLHIANASALGNVTYDDVNVIPSLTTGPVTIKASATINGVEVINMAGQSVMSYRDIPNGFTLDLSSEPDGVYLIMVHTGSHVSTVKVMKRSR